ncbi:MAG: hypothetical protein KO316_01690 [Methanobacterium sp.]|nr:hypothetical protein [Methanobacterium sp.]
MFISLSNEIVLIILVSSFVVLSSGCMSLEDTFENSILSFNIPENWTVVDVTSTDSLVGLKPLGTNTTLIDITSTDVSPQSVVDNYLNNYPQEYPRFQVITQESVTVDGENGIKLVYKNTGRDDVLFTGPEYISSLITFSKYNQTYIIRSDEVLIDEYQSRVEPAMNTLARSIKIKDNYQ